MGVVRCNFDSSLVGWDQVPLSYLLLATAIYLWLKVLTDIWVNLHEELYI